MSTNISNDGVQRPVIKTNPITDDYLVTRHVLGLGINGKVVECTQRTSNQKYALKVGTLSMIN